jgi:hypothetical protein
MSTPTETNKAGSTKQHVTIRIKQDRIADYNMGTLRFGDIQGYSLNGPYLIIQVNDNTQHVYPMDSVATLTLTNTKE